MLLTSLTLLVPLLALQQPLSMHDTDDLFPGLSDPRGMGQPGAIPKKVADLTRSAFVAEALG